MRDNQYIWEIQVSKRDPVISRESFSELSSALHWMRGRMTAHAEWALGAGKGAPPQPITEFMVLVFNDIELLRVEITH